MLSVHVQMDAVTAYGVEFPVSVWMKRVAGVSPITPPTGGASHDKPAPLRVIVVIEPVERSSAFFTMDQDGKIVSCDPWFAVLFGFSDSPEVIGKSILEFIPSLKLPASSELIDKVRKQRERVIIVELWYDCRTSSISMYMYALPWHDQPGT